MRILIVNTGYLPVPPESAGPLAGGSIELHTYYLVNELARLGNEVHYITNVTENASFVNGVTLHKLPYLSFNVKGDYLITAVDFTIGGSFAFGRALEAINRYEFDVVHGHGDISSALLLPFVKKSKYIFTVHNRTPWMLPSLSLKQVIRKLAFIALDFRIIRNAHGVITVSKNLKREIVNCLKIDPAKVRIIPNGVDLKLFRPSIPNSASIRSKYNINYDYVLFVGRLVEEKGVQNIIKAIVGTKLHVLIVGDGPLFPFLRSLSVRLNVDRQVHFIGSVPRSEMPRFYDQATLFVLPSLAEGAPLAGLEAMASGLPLIVSHNSGMNDIVIPGFNGFIVSEIKEMRQRLVQLFEGTSLRTIMSERSRKIAESQFSWESIARRTLQLYKDLLSDNSKN